MRFDLDATLEILERTPRTLEALLSGLSPAWQEGNEGPETFSPKDVLGHLIHGEETDWIPRLRIVLSPAGLRRFETFDRFAFKTTLATLSVSQLLERFSRLRGESLRELKSLDLSPSQLTRTATHPELGEVTLEQLLATWAVHDLGHVRQVVRVMAKQYREAVGPWVEYLRILTE